MEPSHNTKTKVLNRDYLKLDNELSYKGNMYRRRYCLKWRFSLILNSLRVSTCLMILSRVLYVRAPFILKLPWYLVVFAKGGRSKSRLLVL